MCRASRACHEKTKYKYWSLIPGKLKERVQPEDAVMNVDNGLAPPICMVPGHAWQDIVHDDSVSWLGFFKDGGGESMKYIMMDKTSKVCFPLL